MIKTQNKGKTDEYVYDISLDGTVVNALGMNVMSNTDGFNFQMPPQDKFRYTKEHPYISNGRGRNSEKGKAYTEVKADVCEFEDLFLNESYATGINKMGLGIDEIIPASINFSRKNYADLLDNGKIKLVGNTIKSKKMPLYIEKFLNKAIDLLLNKKGKEFIESYYDYIEKIYNLQIPLKEIASVGKIKTSIETYKESCNQLTAGGTKKARQAWYELAIKHGLDVNMGDAIYYINTGSKKSVSDVQRITKYFDGNDEVTKTVEKGYAKYRKDHKGDKEALAVYKNAFAYGKTIYPNLKDKDELIFNCVLLPNSIVEDEEDHFCDETFEYNVDKYIEMFNKRIRPLLVCFDRKMRMRVDEKGKEVDYILISNPKDRRVFTEEECELVSGQPYEKTDQDTYEQLMTMEDKEIKFWLSMGKKPIFVEECQMNWDEIVSDYNVRMEKMQTEEIQNELKRYNDIISSLRISDVTAFIEEGTVPDSLLSFVDMDTDTDNFKSRKYDVVLGSIYDIIDKDFSSSHTED